MASHPKMTHPSYDELLSQLPKVGRDFVTGPPFYKEMSEAAREAKAMFLFNVDNEHAVREFSRFLALKIYVRDTMADQLSPTPLMDAVWHQLILDTQVYEELQDHIGFKLHHRPSGASDAEAEARKVRLVVMESLYSRFFGSKPILAGDNSQHVENAARDSAVGTRRGINNPQRVTKDKNSTRIVFKSTGKLTPIDVPNDSKYIKSLIQDKEGIPPDQILAVWKGRKIEDHETVVDLGMVDGDIVHILITLRAC